MSVAPDPDPPIRATLTRQAIVDAARSLVSESGLESLSLRRLAGALGVTAPALYAHVRDKSDLLAQVAEAGFGELLTRCRAITADDPIDRIRQQCLIYVDMAVVDPGLFQVMFRFPPTALGISGSGPTLSAASDAFEEPARAIAAAIEAGSIHPDHDPSVTALTMWTVAHGLASVLLLGVSTDAEARRALEESVLGAALRGLRLPPA